MKVLNGNKDYGFVSIFTVLIIMTILSLVAIGFSNITRRAERRTLDNQLNIQAFYAAESGVNEARTKLLANPSLTKPTCKSTGDGFNYDLNTTLGVSYTCVLIFTSLPSIEFDSVPVEGTSSPKVFAFEADPSGSPIKSFDIEWDGTGDAAGNGTYSSSLGYPNILGPTGVTKLGALRIDLVPTGLGLDRLTLTNKAYSFIVLPVSDGSASGFAAPGILDQAGLIPIDCGTSPSSCKAHIDLGSSTTDKYFMRLQSIYNTTRVKLIKLTNNLNQVVNFKNGQASIDVTGKANDVFRRIQVRVPIDKNGATIPYALQAGDSICKRLRGMTPTPSDIDGSLVPAADTAAGGACNIL